MLIAEVYCTDFGNTTIMFKRDGAGSPKDPGMHQFVLFCTSTIFVSSTFSVFRPRYFDLLSNLDFLLVEKYRSKYSLSRNKDVRFKDVKSVGRSTEKIEDMKMVEVQKMSNWCVPKDSNLGSFPCGCFGWRIRATSLASHMVATG